MREPNTEFLVDIKIMALWVLGFSDADFRLGIFFFNLAIGQVEEKLTSK